MFCPSCQGGRRDHVDVGWFQRMCLNGVEWPLAPQVTCVLCMDSMGDDRVAVHVGTKRSMLVALLSLSLLVG